MAAVGVSEEEDAAEEEEDEGFVDEEDEGFADEEEVLPDEEEPDVWPELPLFPVCSSTS